MKILHVITALVYGGAEKLLVNTCNVMVNEHDITVCYLKDEPRLASQFDPRVKIVKAPYGLGTIPFLRNLYKSLKPDVIHTHCNHAIFLGLIAAAGLRTKTFLTVHSIWIKWNWIDYIIFFFHRVLLFGFAPTCTIIAISDSVKEHLYRRIGLPPHRVVMAYNAIPDVTLIENKEDLRDKLGIPQKSFCLLFIGRLEQAKSVDTLIDAIAFLKDSIPDILAIIVGHGKLKYKLITQAKATGVSDRVVFIEPVPHPEEYYAAADAFVLPSIHEGFGIVILEAFRASLPVVATNIDGPQELIQHGVNGLLFTPKDYQTLADHISRLYNDRVLARRIGIAGHETYLGKFNIVNYAQRLTNIYRQP